MLLCSSSKPTTTGGLLLLAFAAAKAYAAEAQADPRQPPPQRIEVTATGDSDDRRGALSAVQVVGREEIAKFGDTNVTDVLRRVPGLTVAGVPGRGSEVRLNGLGSGYTQILINGDPAPPGFVLDSLSPALIERIEVRRMSTVDLSAQAVAGTINIVLKQAARQRFQEIKVGAGFSNGNESYRIDGQLSDKVDGFSYSLSAGLATADYLWPTEIDQVGSDPNGKVISDRRTSKREFGNDKSLTVTPKFTWKVTEQDKVGVDGLLIARRFRGGTLDSRDTRLGPKPTYVDDDLSLHASTDTARTRLTWSHTFEGGADLEAKLGVNYLHRSASTVFLGFDGVPQLVLDERVNSSTSDAGYVTAGKYRFPFSEGHAVALGWDADSTQRDEQRVQRQSSPTGRPVVNSDENYDADVDRVALFGQDEWDIHKNVSMYIGLRWEGLRTRSVGSDISSGRNDSSVFSPVLQGLWKLDDKAESQLRLGIGRTYRAPQTKDLIGRRYIANDNTPTTPDLQGNPNLHPELAWSLQLAYEHFLQQKAGMLAATVTARRINDVILNELSYSNGGWVSTKVNNGTATVYGLDLEGKVSLRRLARQLPDMDVRGNLGRNWSFVDAVPGPSNRLDSQIPLSAVIGIDWRNGANLSMGVSYSFTDGGDARTSLTQSETKGAKRLLDVYGLWKLDAAQQIRVAATNLLHQDYDVNSTYADADGSLHQFSRSRTYAGLKLTWEVKL